MEYILGFLIVFNKSLAAFGLPELISVFSVLVLAWYIITRKQQLKGIVRTTLVAVVYAVVVQLITHTMDFPATGTFVLTALLNITLASWVINNFQKYEQHAFVYSVALCQGVMTLAAFMLPGSVLWKVDEYVSGTSLNRLKLLYSEPSYLSFVSGIALIICVYQILVYKLSWQIVLAGLILLLDMLLSYGMGGMICLVLAISVMLMAHVAKNRDKIVADPAAKYKWILSATFIVVVLISIIVISPTYGFRLASLIQGTDLGLFYMIKEPVGVFSDIMKETGWKGTGIGQLLYSDRLSQAELVEGFKNAYFYFMAEGGIVGCVLVLGIVIFLIGYVLLYGGILPLALFIYVTVYMFTAGRYDDPVNWIAYGIILAHCLLSRNDARIQEDAELDDSRAGEVVVGIIGAKGLGNYGGYETFVDKLTEYHANNVKIRYLVACKANGQGAMDETKLKGAVPISESEFTYHNAHCFKINVPQIGAAQAIVYDLMAAAYCIRYFRKHRTEKPILYVLTCRIGPFIGIIANKIHELGGEYYVNPDGHEWRRSTWKPAIRRYWKISERLMIKHSDLVICDSKNIETYINATYDSYNPNTTYISYGAELEKSKLADDDAKYTEWMHDHSLNEIGWLIVGRFVPENNYETMIREYMKSGSDRNLVIITNINKTYMDELEDILHFSRDRRIRFVGTVYDKQLLKKIRENAFGYIHGHSVGGTNPSLLEALGSTKMNLLLDVGFNRECGEDSALYWSKEYGSLSSLIDKVEKMPSDEIEKYSAKAKNRIREAYSWEYIAGKYEKVFR